MTREEALNRYDRIRYNLLNSDDKAAVDVAFEALREQEEHTCDTCYGNDMAPDETDNPCWNCKGGLSEWAPREQPVTNCNGLNGWISVEDRLPEPRTPVLTYGRKGAVGIGFTQPTSVKDGKVYFYARYGDHLPTHWMPLPEPPEVTP